MLQALIRSNAGFLLVVASEVFIVFMNVSVKILTEVPLFEVLTYRKSSNLLHCQIILLRMVSDKKSVHMNELSRKSRKDCNLCSLCRIHVSHNPMPNTSQLIQDKVLCKYKQPNPWPTGSSIFTYLSWLFWVDPDH